MSMQCQPLSEADAGLQMPDPEALTRWVVQTFDRAIEQARSGHGSLRLLHAAASLRAATLSEASARRFVRSEHALGRARLQRLLQLAPAAIDWVDRHAGRIDPQACDEFRRHLQRRCDAVIHDPLQVCDEE